MKNVKAAFLQKITKWEIGNARESMSKAKGQEIPFEPAVKNNKMFYEELASISASNGKKTDPTAAKRLAEEVKSDK